MNQSNTYEAKVQNIIKMLNEMDVDGETMEYIINQVGMEQLIMLLTGTQHFQTGLNGMVDLQD
jgi:hypothetical protein